ncbi:HVA22-like protein e [Panicum virgatum]|uniref:HVA22-like protein n=1 Tax=Panicum virgatum TaxID=38727 RepID=A0A8T0RM93_PANVG|nr:HVA22-like protein e [Panicum virgatum]KAG2586046.1 hypothetical protein PVAP13_5NG016800 [Panicum virgatum]
MASVQAMESPSKLHGEQARLLDHLLLHHAHGYGARVPHLLILRIPIWYELKLLFIAWLMLPNFMGAVFIYDKFVVREHLQKHGLAASVGSSGKVKKDDKSPSSSPKDKQKPKSKFPRLCHPKKDHGAY